MKTTLLMIAVVALVGCGKKEPLTLALTLEQKAEAGDAKAQLELGSKYLRGEEVPKDAQQALKWWRKAAEQGHAYAQDRLGSAHNRGFGVPKDKVAAYAWYSIAASNNTTIALMFNRFAEDMTPDQVAEGEALAKEMIAKNPKLIKKKD